ncbi:MAG: class I SAM-dependent methyltransferase [Dokdonella sp.]
MTQITTGLRSLLSLPSAYSLTQNLFGAERARAVLAREYARPEPGQCLLDIGCGTAQILPHLPASVRYVGVDLSQPYIDAARTTHGDRGEFHCVDVSSVDRNMFRDFDIVMATGLLHHLDDDPARDMFRIAHAALRPNGRLITFDGCFAPHQSAAARFIIARDRGRNVRTAEQYVALARDVFREVRVDIRDDLLRIPYTHAILECSR